MRSDKELLELAAKAAGAEWLSGRWVVLRDDGVWHFWNPLTDDGDALRLAVILDIWPYASSTNRVGVWRICEDGKMRDIYGIDCWWGEMPGSFETVPTKQEATRRAIVRAAAEIGRASQDGAAGGE